MASYSASVDNGKQRKMRKIEDGQRNQPYYGEIVDFTDCESMEFKEEPSLDIPERHATTYIINQNPTVSDPISHTSSQVEFSNCNDRNGTSVHKQQQMIDLLISWNMSYMCAQFINSRLNINSFKYMTERDLDKLFSSNQLGDLIQFRQNLKQWRLARDLDVHVSSLDGPENTVMTWLRKLTDNASVRSPQLIVPQEVIPLPPISTPNPSDIAVQNATVAEPKFDLTTYLNSNGKMIYQAYLENNNSLPQIIRHRLIKDIVQYYIDMNSFMHHEEFETVTNEICVRFPTERKETYYSNTGKYPCGRLYTTYKNWASRLRKSGLFPREKRHKSRLDIDPTDDTMDLPSNIDDENGNQTWLKEHTEPWDLVLTKWSLTTLLRCNQIKRYGKNIGLMFKAWPAYRLARGSDLIELDFDYLYPHKGDNLFNKWNDFVEKIIPIFKSQIKEKSSLTKLVNLETLADQDVRDYYLFNLLHAVLVPTGIAKNLKTKKFWKFSINDSQRSFIRKCSSYDDILIVKSEIDQLYADHNISVQPIIFLVEGIEREYYTVYNGITYKYKNLLHSISTTFKLHRVMNLEFQYQCRLVWQFIEKYIFEFEEASPSTALSTLLSILQSLVKKLLEEDVTSFFSNIFSK